MGASVECLHTIYQNLQLKYVYIGMTSNQSNSANLNSAVLTYKCLFNYAILYGNWSAKSSPHMHVLDVEVYMCNHSDEQLEQRNFMKNDKLLIFLSINNYYFELYVQTVDIH